MVDAGRDKDVPETRTILLVLMPRLKVCRTVKAVVDAYFANKVVAFRALPMVVLTQLQVGTRVVLSGTVGRIVVEAGRVKDEAAFNSIVSVLNPKLKVCLTKKALVDE